MWNVFFSTVPADGQAPLGACDAGGICRLNDKQVAIPYEYWTDIWKITQCPVAPFTNMV